MRTCPRLLERQRDQPLMSLWQSSNVQFITQTNETIKLNMVHFIWTQLKFLQNHEKKGVLFPVNNRLSNSTIEVYSGIDIRNPFLKWCLYADSCTVFCIVDILNMDVLNNVISISDMRLLDMSTVMSMYFLLNELSLLNSDVTHLHDA